jgi:DUF4097 and DUF4098 domain-containing protein YvlB
MIRKLSYLAILVLVLAAGSAAAGEHKDYFDETYSMDETGTVGLENINGNVTIEVWDRAEVRVQAEKQASSAKLLQELTIEVDASKSSVRIDTKYPKTRGFSGKLEVEYTLTVPRDAAIDKVELVNGSMFVTGVQGGVCAESVNGKLIARDVAGSMKLSTVNGAIESELSRLDNVSNIEISSVNGKINLAMPSSADAFIDAQTVNGRISNEFGLDVHKGKYVGSDMRGEVGSGRIRVELETVNGGIELNSR